MLVWVLFMSVIGSNNLGEWPKTTLFVSPTSLVPTNMQTETPPESSHSPSEPNHETEHPAENSQEELSPEEIKYRKNLLSVGWIMLTGIGLLGGILVTMVLLLGGLARKKTRPHSPQAELKHPFWYLKPDYKNEQE